jgi:hypothetical protein
VSARPQVDACPRCGAEPPVRARFCPECGAPLDEPSGRTLTVELPPADAAPASTHLSVPRYFGVTPPHLLLGIAAVALVVAIVLFATGHWPYGLILLGLGALLLAAFMEAARRRPPAREPLQQAGSPVRERTRSAWEELRARSQAAAEARRLQNALLLIETERKRAYAALGAAAHAHNAAGEAAARATLAELDAREAALRSQLEGSLADAGERIRKARLPVQETMMVLPSEPAPPPGEATPPQPAVVPEPYPPPDEGNPPEPARVPEPSPDQPRRED